MAVRFTSDSTDASPGVTKVEDSTMNLCVVNPR